MPRGSALVVVVAVVVLAVGRVAAASPGDDASAGPGVDPESVVDPNPVDDPPPARSVVPVAAPAITPTPSGRACASTFYLEPSLLGTFSGRVAVINRVAGGLHFRACDTPWQARLGATIFIGNPGVAGAGFELEMNHAFGRDARLGVHVGREAVSGGHLDSIDLRLHVQDAAWVQAGPYRIDNYPGPQSGVAVGLGFEGTPGAVLGGVELGVGGVLFLMLLSALSHGH